MDISSRHFLIDIDGTITDSIDDGGESLLEILIRTISERDGVSLQEAEKIITGNNHLDKSRLELLAEELNVDLLQYWNNVVNNYKKKIFMYPDALELIQTLHNKGCSMSTATTNGSFVALAKLAIGNLAENMETSYFKSVLGGEEIHPQGKSGPYFYTALLKKLGISTEDAVMIGDTPEADLNYARAGGISKIFIIDRQQSEPVIKKNDGGIYINNLMLILEQL